MTKGAKKGIVYFACFTIMVGVTANFTYRNFRASNLEIYIFNVPGTPSIFIRTPDDVRLLINGGSNSEIIREITKVLPFYSRRIDYVVTTKNEGKRVGGLIDILKRYNIEKVIEPSIDTRSFGLATGTDQVYETFLIEISTKTLKAVGVMNGDVIELGSDLKLEILFPADPNDFEYSKTSAPEIIFRISYKDSSFLVVGDATAKIQKYIAKSLQQSDVIISFESSANITREIIEASMPTSVVYRAAKEPSKEKTKELAGVLLENRFNIYKRSIWIASDGSKINIK